LECADLAAPQILIARLETRQRNCWDRVNCSLEISLAPDKYRTVSGSDRVSLSAAVNLVVAKTRSPPLPVLYSSTHDLVAGYLLVQFALVMLKWNRLPLLNA
jgi:hypothetical protein